MKEDILENTQFSGDEHDNEFNGAETELEQLHEETQADVLYERQNELQSQLSQQGESKRGGKL